MTRAKDELVLTSAADYGAGRAAQGLALRGRGARPALASTGLAARARRWRPWPGIGRLPSLRRPAIRPSADDEVLRLSYGQIDDYETCPLKYRYVHVLRVPLLTHHAVVYGHAVHEAVRRLFEARLDGRPFSADDLVDAFRAAWVSEGFLSRTHEEQRLAAGEAMLRRFHAEEAKAPWNPTAVEQEFAFALERNRVQGRYDLVVEGEGHVTIVDFKTGDVREEKAAEKRAQESLQLDLYALAYLRTKGRLPDRVELRFLETGPRGRQAADPGGRHPHRGPRPGRGGGDSAACVSRPRPPGWPAASARSATSVPTRRGRPEGEA